MYKILYEMGGDIGTQYAENKDDFQNTIEENGGEVLHVDTVDQSTWLTNKTIYKILNHFKVVDKASEKFVKKTVWNLHKELVKEVKCQK